MQRVMFKEKVPTVINKEACAYIFMLRRINQRKV